MKQYAAELYTDSSDVLAEENQKVRNRNSRLFRFLRDSRPDEKVVPASSSP
jgi:hypothetical protein